MYLRLSLTDRCNLRCTYCLPADARFAPERASTRELQALATAIADTVPIRKIRLTGGEPTLCDDLVDHVRHARALVPEVLMTSNGVLLEPLLPALQAAGLNRVTISLDALDPERFAAVARRPGLERVLAAIRAAKAAFGTVKINAVALPDTDYAGLVRFAMAEGLHLRFIELMAIGVAREGHAAAHVPAEDQRARIAAAGIALDEAPERDEPTSRVWTIRGTAPTWATVGFITTVTQPFCATCDRLRLSSQGRLHTCLMDDAGTDLLTPLRAGQAGEVRARIRLAVAGKRPPAVQQRIGVMAGIGG